MIYELIAGLLFGSGVGGHALRLVTLEPVDTKSTRARAFIAGAAMVIYAIGGALCLAHDPAGLLIAILFPVVGVTAVVATGHKVDAFQVVLGVPQVVAAVLSVAVLLGGPS